jgi:hypothetical protein
VTLVSDQIRRDGKGLVFDSYGKPKFVEHWKKTIDQPDYANGTQQEFKSSESFVGPHGTKRLNILPMAPFFVIPVIFPSLHRACSV